jgi:hypothetical protein
MKKMRALLGWFGLAILVGVATIAYVRFALPLVPSHGKGGIGVATKGSFVLTDHQINAATCGDVEWHGLSRRNTETINCGQGGALPFSPHMLLQRPLIIHFTPARIYILDFGSFSGGYYIRDQEGDSDDKKLSPLHQSAASI